MKVLRAILATLVALLVPAVPAGAADLSLVGAQGALPLQLAADKSGEGKAHLDLVVRSARARSGRLVIAFKGADGKIARLRQAAAGALAPGPAVVLESATGPHPALPARSARVVGLDFRTPVPAAGAKLDGDALDGVLIVRFVGGSNPTVVARVDGKDPAAAAKDAPLTFDQKKVTVVITRWSGPFSGVDDDPDRGRHPVAMHAHGGRAPTGRDRLATTLIESDKGGSARVALDAPGKTEHGLKEGRLFVRTGDGAQEYSGTLALPPVGKAAAKEVSVLVRVQDAFIWPLLAVLLGVLIGGLGGRWYELHRKRELLRAALKRGVDAYDKALREEPVGDIDDGELVFGSPPGSCGRDWPGWWKARFRAAPTDSAGRLYADIAKARNEEEVAAAQVSIDAALATARRQQAVRSALFELQKALPPKMADASEATIYRDSRSLLERPFETPEDDTAATALAVRIRNQARAVALYREAATLHRSLERELPADSPERKEFEGANTPAEVYRRHGGSLVPTAEQMTSLLERLATLVGTYRRIHAAIPGVELDLASIVMIDGTHEIAEAMRVVVEAALEDSRPPEAIVSGVRAWDWVVFFASAIAVSAAYMLPFWVGKSWGSWDDYATAFFAGALGTVAINWALVPLARSYVPKKAAAAGSGASAGA